MNQKNGILYINNTPVIAIGTSYYPSFHKGKYPVPPDGDRIGIMKDDIAHMKQFGFNQLRVAALGDVSLDKDGSVITDTPLIDAIIEEAAKYDISMNVRIQGYVMNLRGNTDYLMKNENGEDMRPDWSAFIVASLFHEGINRDTDDATAALARHFAAYPNVTALQTYNEPHYPYNGVFDYHPATVAAYRKWCEQNGYPVEEPPHSRPKDGDAIAPWVRWRLFSMKAMSNFLNHAAEISVKESTAARNGLSGCESFTCATSGAGTPKMMNGGLSYFDIAEGMDIFGITTYVHLEGADYYNACYIYDLAESAAATFGKHAWTVEADARTRMPARKLHESVYSILGAGHKGINFYEWKGDYPAADSPNPDNCGFIFHDGTKTEHYDSSKQMIAFINRHSATIAATEKHRDGFGILYSEPAIAAADSHIEFGVNNALRDTLECYRDARKEGVSVDFTRAEDLAKNPLGIRLLVIPYPMEHLTDKEKADINAFAAVNGNAVYYRRTLCTFSAYSVGGYWKLGRPIGNITRTHFDGNPEMREVLAWEKLVPAVMVSDSLLHAAMLDGDGYRLIMLTNSSTLRQPIDGAVLTLSDVPTSAVLLTPDREVALKIEGNRICLPAIDAGGMILLK